jgi:DNA (cytosine-5)-methyltransferase 1
LFPHIYSKIKKYEESKMARRREEGDIKLDFRGKDFSQMSEKGLSDPCDQAHPLKLLELFGGIGAPRRALELCGYNLKSIDYVEVLPYAVMAYNEMFKCGPEPQDIRIWNMSPDVVVHGSPCQDFSNEGMNDLNTGRSILFERVLQILDPAPASGNPELSRMPKVVIWENVPKLLWSFKDILDYYVGVMSEFGYVSKYAILTASDYGIPQKRQRLFTVSILNTESNADKFEFPEKTGMRWSLKDFIDKSIRFSDPEVTLSEKEKSILFQLDDGTWAVKEGTKKGYKEINEWDRIDLAIPGSKNRRGRVAPYASTITCSAQQAVFYNGQFRKLSAKEYMRLMGFRDVDYKKMVAAGITTDQIKKLAGNSICVPVLEAIFKKLIEIGILANPESTYALPQKKKKLA